MSWVPNKARLGGALAAFLLATGAASAAANVLIVRSSGPSARSYPAGRSLPDNARIVLRAGDQVMVLAGGGTRTFRGPGTFSPASAQTGTRTAQNGTRIARIGAVRSAGIVPRGPTIWHVDVTQSGNFCLAGTTNVMLWRPDASTPARLTIAGPGAPRTLQWPAGQPTRAWPRGGAIANGETYSFSQPGVSVPTRITFRVLNTPLTDVQGVAEALIANGCEGQLEILVESQPDQSAGR